MWRVTPPTITAQETFARCTSRVRDPDLRQRFANIAQHIDVASGAFEVAANAHQLHTIVRQAGVGVVSTDEMVAVYDDRMAKKSGPGRALYESIRGGAPHGRCPLCGQRDVTTLDHHLPKRQYAALAVTPLNLVPACTDCNKAKLETYPTTRNNQMLHPYFDNIDDDRWLHGTVISGPTAIVNFHVEAAASWDETTTARVALHFDVLQLAALYASHAAEELRNVQGYLRDLFLSARPTILRSHLAERAESCMRSRRNSWQTATYFALTNSDWYCDGGLNFEP